MTPLRAGVARSDITPRVGVELCGYGPFLGRASTGVHDLLGCRAVVLDADGGPLAIVSCDLIGVLQDTADQVRTEIRGSLGIPSDRVMITCTHSHSGPNTIRFIGWGEPDADYRAGLPGRIASTVQAAYRDLRPARLAVGRTLLEGIARNRVQSDGTGLLDPELTVIRVTDASGRPRAALFHHSAHPVVMGPRNREISGDWAGEAERRLEAELGDGVIACFLNGTCGDVNSSVFAQAPPDGWDATSRLGRRAAEAVASLWPSLSDEAEPTVASWRERVDLPLGAPDLAVVDQILAGYDHAPREGDRAHLVTGVASERFERSWAEAMRDWMARPDRDRLPIEVQAARIGPLALVGVPAEVFTLYGFAIKQRSPFRMNAVVGYANDSVGYVARPQDFDDPGFGSYAAVKAPKILGLPPFRPQVGDLLVDGCMRAPERVGETSCAGRRGRGVGATGPPLPIGCEARQRSGERCALHRGNP